MKRNRKENGRSRGVIIELRPNKEQAHMLLKNARVRRLSKNFLVRMARRNLDLAVWSTCVKFAKEHNLEPQAVRQQWSRKNDAENGRAALKAAGFELQKPNSLEYTHVTAWLDTRRRRWALAKTSQARRDACNNFYTAEKNRIESLMGKRRGAPVGPPKMESRFSNPSWSFQIPRGDWPKKIFSTHIVVPSAGRVRVKENPLPRMHGGEVCTVTIKREGSRWYAVLKVSNMNAVQHPYGRLDGSVGVDLNTGVHGVVLSTGERFPVPKRLEELDLQIRKHQRRNRKKQGPRKRIKGVIGRRASKRWVKQNFRLKDLHREVVHVRRDWLNKITSTLVARYRVIVVEDLNVLGMTRSAKGTEDAPGENVKAKSGLTRKILQASFASFREMLKYKTEQVGGVLGVVDRWFPSSKLCNRCGWKDKTQTLSVRVFRCPDCGLVEDRDRNAARNIRRAYENSVSAAADAENTGKECQPWIGEPLFEGHVCSIKFPRNTATGGKKRKRTKGVTRMLG